MTRCIYETWRHCALKLTDRRCSGIYSKWKRLAVSGEKERQDNLIMYGRQDIMRYHDMGRHRITTNHDMDCDNPPGRDHQGLRPFQAAGDGTILRTRTWRHDHPKLRTDLPGDQPPDTAKRYKSYDGQRIDGLGRGYQPVDLSTQGGHTMNLRQIHDITCDRLETQLVTEGTR